MNRHGISLGGMISSIMKAQQAKLNGKIQTIPNHYVIDDHGWVNRNGVYIKPRPTGGGAMKPKFLEAAESLAADLGITLEELLRRNDAALAAAEEMDDPCEEYDEDPCLCDETWCEFCGEEWPCECDEQMMEGEFDENDD